MKDTASHLSALSLLYTHHKAPTARGIIHTSCQQSMTPAPLDVLNQRRGKELGNNIIGELTPRKKLVMTHTHPAMNIRRIYPTNLNGYIDRRTERKNIEKSTNKNKPHTNHTTRGGHFPHQMSSLVQSIQSSQQYSAIRHGWVSSSIDCNSGDDAVSPRRAVKRSVPLTNCC
ncbi:unnamed protein product [Ectocarpus sp. 12 AP-2014]